MAAAIELYNKPGFPYRNESFSILAINAWELVIKSKWLAINDHDQRSLYVYERRQTKTGHSKKKTIKRTKSGTALTPGLKFLAGRLVEKQLLHQRALSNIEGLLEFRNSASHFYNQSPRFDARIHEIGAACVRNFALIVEEWFDHSVEEFSIFLMPLTFVDTRSFEGALLKADEKQFLGFLERLDHVVTDIDALYEVAISVNLKFTRSTTGRAIPVQKSRDPSALPIILSEENIRQQYPWDYSVLTANCRKRYEDFKINQDYHDRRKHLQNDDRFGHVRHLDPGNPKSQVKVLFSPNILQEFDKAYSKRIE